MPLITEKRRYTIDKLRNHIYTSSGGSITFEVWLMLTPNLVVLSSTLLTSLHDEQGTIRYGGEGK